MKMIEKYEKCAGTDVQGDCKKKKCNKCISLKRDRLMLAFFSFSNSSFWGVLNTFFICTISSEIFCMHR